MPDKGLWRKGCLWGVSGMLLAVPTFSEIGLNNVTSSLQQFEDLELTRRSQAGDTEAFGELVTKYRAKILAMLYGMVRDENDAWDLAQEGFLKAWRSIHRFEGRSSFYTWLYRLTVNLAIESLRRKGRREEVELDEPFPVLFLVLVLTISAMKSVSTSMRLLHSFLQNIALSSS